MNRAFWLHWAAALVFAIIVGEPLRWWLDPPRPAMWSIYMALFFVIAAALKP
jgi:hypothetical protein